MHKKSIVFTILGIVFVLALSGCFSHRFEVQHNPDGSGQFTIETIFTEDYLGLFDETQTMDEARDEILEDFLFTADNLVDDPNIGSVEESDFIDETTGSLHHSLEIEVLDILIPVYFEDEDDLTYLFEVQDNGDGTFMFIPNLESMSEMVDEEEDDDLVMDPEMFRFMLQGSTITWELLVAEFIEGDPQAVYDPGSNTVNWEIPMYDVLFPEETLELYAIYRVDTAETVEPTETPEPVEPDEPDPTEPVEPDPVEPVEPEPEPDIEDPDDIEDPIETELEMIEEGLFGLPNWVTLAVVAVLCLGGIMVIIAVVVIIVIVRKRKQNQP